MSQALAAHPPIRTLLAGAIDYAGLFPPATLQMSDAVRSYAAYGESEDHWALGRFVLPAPRLEEFAEASAALVEFPADRLWRLSAVFGAEIEDDGARVASFNERYPGRFVVDVIEARAVEPNDVRRIANAVPARMTRYAELSSGPELDAALRVARQTGTAAKLRTGGVIAGAFPAPADVLAFLEACHEARVRIKATAGLHHATRGSYRLTYEPEAPSGLMYGFLNVLLAAAVVHSGGSSRDAETILTADATQKFRIGDRGITWAGVTLDTSAITAARADFITGFGSCSFREPIDELAALMGS